MGASQDAASVGCLAPPAETPNPPPEPTREGSVGRMNSFYIAVRHSLKDSEIPIRRVACQEWLHVGAKQLQLLVINVLTVHVPLSRLSCERHFC